LVDRRNVKKKPNTKGLGPTTAADIVNAVVTLGPLNTNAIIKATGARPGAVKRLLAGLKKQRLMKLVGKSRASKWEAVV
jgi:hypothetical protein